MLTTTNVHWNAGTISKPHNERDEELCSHEAHIDLYNEQGSSFHTVIFNKDIREVYEENIGDALDEYNAKQKRKDRQLDVDAYIKSVEDDTRGKKQTKKKNGKRVVDENALREGKQTSYEFTVRVGNTCKKKDTNGRVVYDKNNHHIHEEELPRDLQCICLQRYYDEFEANNPNFKLVSVHRHGDEGFYNRRKVWEYGEIHDHYEIVPFATGFKQGLSVQNSMNKAMSAMGFNNSNCYSEWAKREQERLDKIVQEEYVKYCKNHLDFAKSHGDLTIHHPVAEKTNTGDKTKEQYVAEQELDELIGEADYWKQTYRKKNKDVEKKQADMEQAERQFKDVVGSLTGYEYEDDYDDLPDMLNDLKEWAKSVQNKADKIDDIYDKAYKYLDMAKDYYGKEMEWMGKEARAHVKQRVAEEDALKDEMKQEQTSNERYIQSIVELGEQIDNLVNEQAEDDEELDDK